MRVRRVVIDAAGVLLAAMKRLREQLYTKFVSTTFPNAADAVDVELARVDAAGRSL
jgi:hypothetical protein